MKKLLEQIKSGKKVTKILFRSFLKRNSGDLFIKISSNFDHMADCDDEYIELDTSNMYLKEYYPSVEGETFKKRNYDLGLGLEGVHLVGTRGDYFSFVEDGNFVGIKCVNRCGKFIIAVEMI